MIPIGRDRQAHLQKFPSTCRPYRPHHRPSEIGLQVPRYVEGEGFCSQVVISFSAEILVIREFKARIENRQKSCMFFLDLTLVSKPSSYQKCLTRQLSRINHTYTSFCVPPAKISEFFRYPRVSMFHLTTRIRCCLNLLQTRLLFILHIFGNSIWQTSLIHTVRLIQNCSCSSVACHPVSLHGKSASISWVYF